MRALEKANPAAGKFFDVALFGGAKTQTIYLIGPYKGRLQYVQRFIKKMMRRGYRVLYLQPCPQVLSHSRPKWLGEAINEAIAIIQSDLRIFNTKAYLVGVSLGSYLGLNVQLEIPFKKFVVIAGGAPLQGVFNSTKLFKKSRDIVRRDIEGKASLEAAWWPYDEAYKNCNLSHSSTLLINSKNDRVIRPELLQDFLEMYQKTGVQIINHQRGCLPHTLEALSLNFRTREIDKFLQE